MCNCGRGERRAGQTNCRACHSDDMRARRAAAKARGTYTLAGVGPRYRNPEADPETEQRRIDRRATVDWPRIDAPAVPRGKSRNATWNEKPCSRACGRLRDLPYSAYCSDCRRTYSRLVRRRHSELTDAQRKRANCRSYPNRLIARGALEPQPCEVCGGLDVQPHHRNYDDPRDVAWLCEQHHREWHRERDQAIQPAAAGEQVAR